MNILNNLNGIISLFIACIEILILVNLSIFAEKNKINKIIFIIIALLASYQAFEFLICNVGIDSSITAYLAFVVISFLPPLNLLLILLIFRLETKLNFLIFIPAIFFSVFYLFIIEQFEVVKCTVLYATYNYPLGDLYGFFYYLPILFSFIVLIKKRNSIKPGDFTKLLIAHLFIVLPVATGFMLLYLNLPDLVANMESILCKFAFGYAIALSIFCLNSKELYERNNT